MALSGRSQAREMVLRSLYALEMGKSTPADVLKDIMEGEELDEQNLGFASFLIEKAKEHREWSDKFISELAHNWRLERIAVIDQIILRMAMTELKEMPDTPVKVVLNEAIELAKLYSTGESSAFINGILDSFVKNFPAADKV